MQRFTAATANKLTADMTAKASGNAITSGTVTGYLVADSGTNTGKWWDSGGSTWSATEVSAGACTFKGGSSWQVSVASDAWVTGTKYTFYATESGALHIPYSESVVEVATYPSPGPIEFEYTVTDSGTGLPIADVVVWVTTDSAGLNTIDKASTNNSGVVTFYLEAATYYVWRKKAGYSFTNPDTEVVS